MSMIYLYVEVLANIRQANFYASLETYKNEHTKIDIASDKKTITVSHDGETASIYLPTEIGGTAEVNIPVDRSKEMSVRLELADIMNMPSVENAPGDEAPWSANDLGLNTQLRCRECKTEILTNELPLQFKDLPSEHWAEMMDIWHCHKPQAVEPDKGEDAGKAADFKGYGASTKLKAAAGIAFVDAAFFLFAEQSCKDVQVLSTILSNVVPCTLHSRKWCLASTPCPSHLPLMGNKKETFPRPVTVSCLGHRYNCPISKILADHESCGIFCLDRWIISFSNFNQPQSFSATSP